MKHIVERAGSCYLGHYDPLRTRIDTLLSPYQEII